MARCKFIKQKIRGAATDSQHLKTVGKNHDNLLFYTVVEKKPTGVRPLLEPPFDEKIGPLPPVTNELTSALAQLLSSKDLISKKNRRKRHRNSGVKKFKITSYLAFKLYYARFIDRVPQSRISTVLGKVWVSSYPYKSAWEEYVEQYYAYKRDLGIIEWMDKLFVENNDDKDLLQDDFCLSAPPSYSSSSSCTPPTADAYLLADNSAFSFDESTNPRNSLFLVEEIPKVGDPEFGAAQNKASGLSIYNPHETIGSNEFVYADINIDWPFSQILFNENIFTGFDLEFQIDFRETYNREQLAS